MSNFRLFSIGYLAGIIVFSFMRIGWNVPQSLNTTISSVIFEVSIGFLAVAAGGDRRPKP